MKRKKFLKMNIAKIVLSGVLILTFAANAFADEFTEKWGPAAFSVMSETVSPEVAASAISDYDFNQQNATGQITSGDMAAIRQIVIAEPNATATNQAAANGNYVATQVAVPTPITETHVIAPNATMLSPATTNGAIVPNITNGTTVINTVTMNELNLATFTNKTDSTVKKVETEAPSFALINATTREIYTTKDVTTKYNPSGLTNLMTAYIASKHLTMSSPLKVNASALRNIDKDASIAALAVGDTITLKDAIGSMFVKGCVDSSNVVAEAVAGSINNFVALMNTTAVELGLTNTKFVDPSGIGENESTALDMAIIMAKVCENPELVELLTLTQYKLPKTQKRDQLILYSRNTMLNKDNATYNADVKASRLAYASNPKYCIASYIPLNNNNLFAVVLKANGQQFVATRKLIEYAKATLGIEIPATTTTNTNKTTTTKKQ